ncbi:hypothetical protein GCM10023095_16300 [Pseudaeromonas paramecii]|uniref:Transposase n=1 Tax=Pseudaeromonas paramecii TaxID=2138166 RepID=A0ABP8Q923_9GAMM
MSLAEEGVQVGREAGMPSELSPCWEHVDNDRKAGTLDEGTRRASGQGLLGIAKQ